MKRLTALCLTLAILTLLFTIFCSADTETPSDPAELIVRYGKAELSLTLLDAFDEEQSLPGFMNWGNGTMTNGHIYMECAAGSLYDIYSISTASLQGNPSLSDSIYTVLAAQNTSDGDIFFGIQPDVVHDEKTIHAYLSSELAKNAPVKLIHKDGTVEDAAFWNQRSAGREVFLVPYEFDGYIVIPHAILATDIESTTAVSPEGKLNCIGWGLHALPDDASYMEFTITAAYACSTLPAYEAPAPETNPESEPESEASKPTETDTEAAGSVSDVTDTESESASTATAPESQADTTASTQAQGDAAVQEKSSGCAASVSVAALLVMMAAAGVVLKRK